MTVGFAMCGSFCTLEAAMEALKVVCRKYDNVLPVMSENTYGTDSRFGTADGFIKRMEELCKKPVIHTIPQAEPIGPKGLLDILVIAPCTGNTLAKLAGGITDTCVTMAAKAHLRNGRPVLIAVSTNDGLSASAVNIGELMNRKNIYFVPYRQDDPIKKPNSLVADMKLIPEAIAAALAGRQLQPVFAAQRAETPLTC